VEFVGVLPPGVQENVTPDVPELPVSVADKAEHVIYLVGPAETLGKVVFVITATVLVAVQPLAGSFTLRVYVPAAVTAVEDEFGVVPPGVQVKVAPGVLELPVSVTVKTVQVIVLVGPAFTLGKVVFEMTATV